MLGTPRAHALAKAREDRELALKLIDDEATAENLKVTVANFRTVSTKIANGEGTIGKLLVDDQLYKDAQGVIKKADRALDSMGDQGPISAVGVAAGALF